MTRPNRSTKPEGKSSADGREAEPFILLTGSRHEEQFRIDVDGKPIFLSCVCFIALVDLVYARIQRNSGFRRIAKSTVHRLRKALGGAGSRLIETGSGQEYRLAIPKDKIGEGVRVTPCFFELADPELGIVAEAQAAVLRKTCTPCDLRETET